MEETIRTLTVYALPVLFAITLHEAAHAYAAKFFGDNTAYSQGRMSLNPLVHVDPLGTILIPILTFAFTPFVFGYAKPVPVEFGRLRNPKRDMAWVALAGPGANLLMAIMWLIFARLVNFVGIEAAFWQHMAQAGIFVNLLIMAFNLLPIPPLDGGRVVTSILPHKLAYAFARIEPYGFFIVLGLLFMRVIGYWLEPVMTLGRWIVHFAALPFTFFLL